jgi:protein-S-isoprenylcysteine O-methyltransferase Ste14
VKLLLKNLLFSVLVPGTVAVAVPLWLTRPHAQPTLAALLEAAPLLLVGLGIYVWCVWDFAHYGRGTPAPIDAPRSLVVHGPYRLVRNPMYVAVLATVLGWSTLLRSPKLLVYASGVWLCFQLFVTLYEEPHLRRIFGEAYLDYCARVGRWLPRF